jgi:putative nucleotidyltransferase with HDIG domain
MILAKTVDVIRIIERTLFYIEPTLIGHGNRVAHTIYNVLKHSEMYNDSKLRDICMATLLHDVGAYRTEEIRRMKDFELHDYMAHSVYGYLFVREFTPLKELAHTILFHHSNFQYMSRVRPEYRFLSQLIFAADRLDMMTQFGNHSPMEIEAFFLKQKGRLFSSDAAEAVLSSFLDNRDNDYMADADFQNILCSKNLSDAEIESYLRTIVLSIDFRSRQTANHTMSTTVIAVKLAELCGFVGNDLEKMRIGAMLHDLGKTAIPLHILENPGKLDMEQMAVMRTHVKYSDEILLNNVTDDIRKIAVRHHEKLDGSGYPYGIKAAELTTGERIMGVADILSALCGERSYKTAFPKERVADILTDMSSKKLLDSDIVAVALDNYDDLLTNVRLVSEPLLEQYAKIENDYKNLTKLMSEVGNTACIIPA